MRRLPAAEDANGDGDGHCCVGRSSVLVAFEWSVAGESQVDHPPLFPHFANATLPVSTTVPAPTADARNREFSVHHHLSPPTH